MTHERAPKDAARELASGLDVLFVARLAFDNLTDLGAVAPLVRRSLDLILGSVLTALGVERSASALVQQAASALEEAGFWSPGLALDLQRALDVSQRAPESVIGSRAERVQVAEALAAARRLARAVQRFHDSRRAPWARENRRLLRGALLALALGLLGFAVYRIVAPVEGLAGVYFADTNFQKAVLRRVDPVIDFAWADGSPAPELRADKFSVEWSGTLLVPETAEYVVYLTSDDGSRLFMDGRLVIDHWGEHSVDPSQQKAVALTQGRMPIRLRYFEQEGRAVVRLGWSSKHIPRSPIASRYLRPEQ